MHGAIGVDRHQQAHLRIVDLLEPAEGEAHLRQALVGDPLLGDRGDLIGDRERRRAEPQPLRFDAGLLRAVQCGADVLELLAGEREVGKVEEGLLGDLQPAPAEFVGDRLACAAHRVEARRPAVARGELGEPDDGVVQPVPGSHRVAGGERRRRRSRGRRRSSARRRRTSAGFPARWSSIRAGSPGRDAAVRGRARSRRSRCRRPAPGTSRASARTAPSRTPPRSTRTAAWSPRCRAGTADRATAGTPAGSVARESRRADPRTSGDGRNRRPPQPAEHVHRRERDGDDREDPEPPPVGPGGRTYLEVSPRPQQHDSTASGVRNGVMVRYALGVSRP